ncbi:hypothetical protein GGQ85_003033 [Nitrobacter vulgaris]|nr:hypothetical protein [Nitrobacter vulgaris]MDR6305311.1 hypothetical protein [Nitrobacter vulgaris]
MRLPKLAFKKPANSLGGSRTRDAGLNLLITVLNAIEFLLINFRLLFSDS